MLQYIFRLPVILYKTDGIQKREAIASPETAYLYCRNTAKTDVSIAKKEVTPDRFTEPSGVTSLNSWYLTSLVNLAFFRSDAAAHDEI